MLIGILGVFNLKLCKYVQHSNPILAWDVRTFLPRLKTNWNSDANSLHSDPWLWVFQNISAPTRFSWVSEPIVTIFVQIERGFAQLDEECGHWCNDHPHSPWGWLQSLPIGQLLIFLLTYWLMIGSLGLTFGHNNNILMDPVPMSPGEVSGSQSEARMGLSDQ